MTVGAISILKPQSGKCDFSIERQLRCAFLQSDEATAWDLATFLWLATMIPRRNMRIPKSGDAQLVERNLVGLALRGIGAVFPGKVSKRQYPMDVHTYPNGGFRVISTLP